jgi:hypothetical protein
MEQLDVEFEADGRTMRGWLFLPEGDGPFPAVCCAPPFAATKEFFKTRNPTQDVFVAAGIATLIYDPPFLGDSDGEPRGEADAFMACRALQDAITFLQLHDAVDADRIGIWGTSWGGGHVLSVASHDRRIKAVVSQAMTVSGRSNLLRRRLPEEYAELHTLFAEDRRRRARGEEPLRGTYPGAFDPEGRLTLRTFELYDHYEPTAFIHRISPTPLLMIVPDRDDLCPTEDQLEAYERALEPKRLLLFRGGHYAIYDEEFDLCSSTARDFFLEHL